MTIAETFDAVKAAIQDLEDLAKSAMSHPQWGEEAFEILYATRTFKRQMKPVQKKVEKYVNSKVNTMEAAKYDANEMPEIG